MVSCRTASRVAVAFVVALFVVPSSAFAATPPVLEAPASGAATFKEGSGMKFEWRGALQGDADTLTRSFFRLEIIKASDMPSGAQSEWTNLENFVPTEPGEAVGELTIGVPTTGSYRWRVCAWGVVDDVVANEIVQLPGGCSVSRAFETSAVADSNQTPGELKIEKQVTVPGRVETVTVTRPGPVQPAEPAPAPEPEVVAPTPEPTPEPLPTTFSDIVERTLEGSGSALDLGNDAPLASDAASEREGLSGSVLNGLSGTLPIIPIPFWTIALLLACIPVARLWRRDVLGMFDWNDGTTDGSGSLDDEQGDLSSVQDTHGLKVPSTIADAEAPAPVSSPFSAPERGRRAA